MEKLEISYLNKEELLNINGGSDCPIPHNDTAEDIGFGIGFVVGTIVASVLVGAKITLRTIFS